MALQQPKEIRTRYWGDLTVLYVNDDPENLQVFSYALVDECRVVTCETSGEALAKLRGDPSIAVVVAGHPLGGIDRFEFVVKASALNPRVVFMILSAQEQDPLAASGTASSLAQYHTWAEALRRDAEGHLRLVGMIREAGQRYAQRDVALLVATHAPTILRRLIELRAGTEAATRLVRIERLCSLLRPYLDLTLLEGELLLLTALLSDLGRIVVPEEGRDPGNQFRTHAARRRATGELLRSLPGMELVHEAVADVEEHWDGTGPSGKRGEAISPLGRILTVVGCFDRVASDHRLDDAPGDRPCVQAALQRLQAQSDSRFDPEIVTALCQMVDHERMAVETLYS